MSIPDPGKRKRAARRARRAALYLLPALLAASVGCRARDRAPSPGIAPVPRAVVAYNRDPGGPFSFAQIDSMLDVDRGRPTAERVGAWARRFRDAGGSSYLFGPAEGGYVAEGRLALDERQDCVSLMYRCTELGQARDAVDALGLALRLRFSGAPIDSIVGPDGRVDYDRPEHLDYSLDMIRSGDWGEDITAALSGARPDTIGTSRYPAGSFVWVPEAQLRPEELREGDVAWLALDPADEGGRKLRDRFGLVIGHLGIVIVQEGRPWLVHAASRPLPGWYERDGVVAVPLDVYLERVEKLGGLMVTRFR